MVMQPPTNKNIEFLVDQFRKLLDDEAHERPEREGRERKDGKAIGRLDDRQRREQAFLIRLKAALFQREKFSFEHPNNGDEQSYANQNYIGNYGCN